MSSIAERKLDYIRRYTETLDESKVEGDAHAVWAKWWFSYLRLVQDRELDKANAWLETVSLKGQPWKGPTGQTYTHSDNFRGIKYLKTLLDFGDSPRLSDKAKAHMREEFTGWVGTMGPFPGDNLREARYPVIHTENHDLMALTIGMFREIFAGRDASEHVRQLSQSLAWRFDPGFEEWQSHVYQAVYMMPLLLLIRHAPDANLRDGARQLANLIFAERALLSVNGHFPGPMIRGYQDCIDDDRKDLLLPAMWMCFGTESIRPLGSFGMEFAVSSFEPGPLVVALAEDVARLPVLEYRGTRPAGLKGRQTIVYYNTRHIGMGSMQIHYYRYQARYFDVMFASEPSMSLRIDLPDTFQHSPWDHRNDKGEVAQYRNWLVSHGTLVECGGLKPVKAGEWNLYRVGKGLCAHVELPGQIHVFQTGDLDQYADERAFLSALDMPRRVEGSVEGRASDGAPLRVRLDKMKMWVSGRPREDWREVMHDCPLMSSRFGTGTVEIRTSRGNLTLSNRGLLANLKREK